jgi:demethylspheroidene O-methyltransferase
LLSSPAFHHFAARFAPFRPIAQSRARDLFDLTAGFIYSQVVAAVVELRLLEAVAEGPRQPSDLADVADAPPDALERLLTAAVGLDLLSRVGSGDFALGPQGAALLGNPGLRGMVAHHRQLYMDLADPVALVRRGGGQGDLARYWAYARAEAPGEARAADVADYSTLMAASVPSFAADVLQAYPFHRHRRLMDVGGGEGAFLIAAAAAAPKLELALFDLPAVVDRARTRLARAGLADRAQVTGGDFGKDDLPAGADLVTLVRIVHDHDDPAVLTLLRAIRKALAPGGRLVIAEPMSLSGGRDRVADVYFAMYLMAMGHGRARTPAEIAALLKAAGFHQIRFRRTASLLSLGLIVAR